MAMFVSQHLVKVFTLFIFNQKRPYFHTFNIYTFLPKPMSESSIHQNDVIATCVQYNNIVSS